MGRRIVLLLLAGILLCPAPLRAADPDEDKEFYYVIIGGILLFIITDMYSNIKESVEPVSFPEKSQAERELYYLGTNAELNHLNSLTEPEQVQDFMDEFWRRHDPQPATLENELRIEYLSRLDLVDEMFSGNQTRGWRTDRGRALLLYGEPLEKQFIQYTGYFGKDIYDMEIWIYDFPASRSGLNTVFDYPYIDAYTILDTYRSQGIFIFCDIDKIGSYKQIYSNVSGEFIDPRVYLRLSK